MTTPSPDKIEIPEAAVEAACWAHAPQWGRMDETIKTYARQQMRAALTAARSYIPHMPDRGYAEVEQRRQFVIGYATRSKLGDVVVTDFGIMGAGFSLIAMPCDCGDEDCIGWQMTSPSSLFYQLLPHQRAALAPPAPADTEEIPYQPEPRNYYRRLKETSSDNGRLVDQLRYRVNNPSA